MRQSFYRVVLNPDDRIKLHYYVLGKPETLCGLYVTGYWSISYRKATCDDCKKELIEGLVK